MRIKKRNSRNTTIVEKGGSKEKDIKGRERMKKTILALVLLVSAAYAQENLQSSRERELYRLARTDLKSFAREVSEGAGSELTQAQMIVTWLAKHFEWKSTDYRQRTVQEIIDRGGGNCNDLALVAVAALKELGVPMRRVHEINVHKLTPERGETAHNMVKEKGVRFSVFGRHHNDHIWIEIHDSKTDEWYPADPSIGIVGTREWLMARAGFGKRFTLDRISEDMIVPFAVFAADEKGAFTINRTSHYMIEEFGGLYKKKLSDLPSWNKWVRLIDELDEKAGGAFVGTVNLHDYENEIDELANVYSQLREEFLKK